MRPLAPSRIKYWRARFARLFDLALDDLESDEWAELLEQLKGDVERRQ